jgi:O-antigen/teichoic acid export membrane protein
MKDLRERVARGFGWVLGSTVAGRLIQLAALAITTILLTPEDFGLLAVVTASTMLIERLTTFGLDGALVQSREVTPKMLNVAWSYQLARNLILGAGTFLAAPWLAALFREPAAEQMIRVAALAFPLSGARNIGLVELRRRLDFKRLGYVNLIPLLVHAPTAVALTLAWRNVWALVCASLAMVAAGLVVSYCFAPHRPRLDFHWATARPMFSFGLCLLGNTMLQTIREQGVVLVVARTMGSEALGYYNRALAFSFTLFVQAQEMFWRVMFPALSRIQTDPIRLRAVWRRLTLGALLAGVGGGACYIVAAPWAVRWVLGEQWLPMVPLMQLFGLYAALAAITTPSEVLFQAMGRPGIGTRFQLVSTVIVAALLWPGVKWGGWLASPAPSLVRLPL